MPTKKRLSQRDLNAFLVETKELLSKLCNWLFYLYSRRVLAQLFSLSAISNGCGLRMFFYYLLQESEFFHPVSEGVYSQIQLFSRFLLVPVVVFQSLAYQLFFLFFDI